MNPKIEDIVATLRTYAPDEDGTSRFILIPAAGRGATAEYPVTIRSHRTDFMRDAADLIEQLHQELIDERYRHDRYADFCVAQGEELSRLKAQQRWIPVTERLPEESGRYLTRERFGTDILSYEVLKTKGKWKTKYKDVTHWMPLPERPKEG